MEYVIIGTIVVALVGYVIWRRKGNKWSGKVLPSWLRPKPKRPNEPRK